MCEASKTRGQAEATTTSNTLATREREEARLVHLKVRLLKGAIDIARDFALVWRTLADPGVRAMCVERTNVFAVFRDAPFLACWDCDWDPGVGAYGPVRVAVGSRDNNPVQVSGCRSKKSTGTYPSSEEPRNLRRISARIFSSSVICRNFVLGGTKVTRIGGVCPAPTGRGSSLATISPRRCFLTLLIPHPTMLLSASGSSSVQQTMNLLVRIKLCRDLLFVSMIT